MKCFLNNSQYIMDEVAPFAGAWIEIERYIHTQKALLVAPFAGAWIEITVNVEPSPLVTVAPFAGAWIEICRIIKQLNPFISSLPSRERGLKSIRCLGHGIRKAVAPFAGAWIEIYGKSVEYNIPKSRSLRGSVD